MIAAALLLGLATVDGRVQAAVDREVAGGAEAVVVLDVATGGVLARGGHVDRALPPGSTFKLVDVIAAAATRPEALAGTVRCSGRARLSGRDVKCHKADGHGDLPLEEALAQSCNIYFGAVGALVGTPALLAAARAVGVDADGGRLPHDSAPAALVADGEGVLVTALKQARLMRQIARGRRLDDAPLAPPEVLGRLRRGLRAAVEHGTAAGAASSVAVAGKTGTAGLGPSSVGWFLGYAPADAPTVVLAIAQRNCAGREVAKHAVPLLEAFFHGR